VVPCLPFRLGLRDAWDKVKGKSKEEAAKAYVERLKEVCMAHRR
jgi:acyl-CoA-binding protein